MFFYFIVAMVTPGYIYTCLFEGGMDGWMDGWMDGEREEGIAQPGDDVW